MRGRTRKFVMLQAAAAALLALVILVPAVFATEPEPELNTGAGSWQWLRPDVQGGTIFSTFFIDANTGWAASNGGVILKTTDGGANWTAQFTGNLYNFWDIHFIDANTGWAVGDYGTIYKTVDGGTTWTKVTGTPIPAVTLQSVYFADASYGMIAAEGSIYRTVDGGVNWAKAGSEVYSVTLGNGGGYVTAPTVTFGGGGGSSAAATASLDDVIVGGYITAPGSGYTSAPTANFTGGAGSGATGFGAWSVATISVTASGSGYTTAPTVTITGGSGGGATATATMAGAAVTSITVTNQGTGYLSVPTVTISGGGGTGATATASLTPNLTSVNITNGGNGYTSAPDITFTGGGGTGAAASGTRAVTGLTLTNPGIGYTSVPTVSFTGNSSATATATATLDVTGAAINDIHMINNTTAWAVGQSGTVYRLTRSGSTWTAARQDSGTTNELWGVSFKDANNGFAVGAIPDGGGGYVDGRLLRTTDGGATWSKNDTTPVPEPLKDLTVSGDTIVTVGKNGAVYQRSSTDIWSGTVDSVAASLTPATSGVSTELWSVSKIYGGTVYAGGAAGVIVKSTDSGAGWSQAAGGLTATTMQGIGFFDGNTGVAVGDGGLAVRTINGGASWDPGTGVGATHNLYGVHMFDANNAVAVGCDVSSGTACVGAVAYKTTNGGSTWTAMTVPGGLEGLRSVRMFNSSTGWAVGSNGAALKTTDGINWVAANTGIAADVDLFGVDTIDGSQVWAAGSAPCVGAECDHPGGGGQTTKGVLAKYDSGSGTWTVQYNLDASSLNSIDVVTDGVTTVGYAVGYHSYYVSTTSYAYGRAYKTDNAGAATPAWTPQNSGTSKLLASVSFSSVTNGFATGSDGRVIHTRDGGATWYAENLGTNLGMMSVSAVGERKAFVSGTNGSVLRALRPYYFTWYDSIYSSSNLIQMANPASAAQGVYFDVFVGGNKKGSYTEAPNTVERPSYAGLLTGPVNVASLTSEKAIVSQRIVFGASSLEEVAGTDIERLSDTYYWTWYDGVYMKNWVLVSNPNPFPVYYELKIGTSTVRTATIEPGKNDTPRFDGVIGGPVEVKAYTSSAKTAPAQVIASQRALFNNDTSFNEETGIPAQELSDRYLWTWYDNIWSKNWVLVANPSNMPGQTSVDYVIKVAGITRASGTLAPGERATPMFDGLIGGPVEVTAKKEGTSDPAKVIASQRVIFGPSFEETPGYPASSSGGVNLLSSSYHWAWYDQQTAGMKDWVLVANPGTADTVQYRISIAGQQVAYGELAPGQSTEPMFAGYMNGPLEVKAWLKNGDENNPADRRPVMSSQRVLFNGHFNEMPGAVLD